MSHRIITYPYEGQRIEYVQYDTVTLPDLTEARLWCQNVFFPQPRPITHCTEGVYSENVDTIELSVAGIHYL